MDGRENQEEAIMLAMAFTVSPAAPLVVVVGLR
jgi:hypothetical protein